MIAEIVTIGTEMLLGEIVDSNAAHIARELALVGVDHYFTTTVGDNEERIVDALRAALLRSDAVITTGGLGPTVDDVTRQAAARVTSRSLVCSEELLAQIASFFERRGYTMTENNRQQACLPEGAIPIENPVGTAPAFIVETGANALICLPGVPHEMDHLLRSAVLPYLTRRMGESAVILGRLVHTVAIGESAVDQAITDLMRSSNPTVGTRAHPGQTDVCITAKAHSVEEARALLDAMEDQVRKRLGAVVYGVDAETLPGVVVSSLGERRLKLALAETASGGLVARRLLQESGGVNVVAGVRIALDRVALAQGLAVEASTRDEKLAPAIAAAVRETYEADVGLAVLAEDRQGAPTTIALSAPDGPQVRQWPARGYSDYAMQWTLHYALDMVRRWLMGAR